MVEPAVPVGNRRPGRWLLPPAAFGGGALLLVLWPDEQAVIRESAAWRAFADENRAVALAAFAGAEVVLIALSVPVGIWMSVLAGFLFGTWVGTAVVNGAGTAGAVLAFLSARYVFAGAIHRAARARPRVNRWLTGIDRGLREHGGYYLLLLRLTPVIPFWFLNLALGVTRVRLRDYWWTTQLGMLPVTLVVVNAGASLAEITTFRDVLSLRALGSLCLLPLGMVAVHRAAGRFLAPGRSAVRLDPPEGVVGGSRPTPGR
jgi:uncharacterized membrane protein YdjX (TVP38/TMEM64 family)